MNEKERKQAKPTLKDVAERAGVSIGTASNAFNRPQLLSDELRERVLDEAQSMGYGGPDPAARRLRTGRAGALGLIFTDRLPFAFDDEAAVIFLRGVAAALERTGDGLLLIPTSPTRKEGARVVRESAVDGFLVYSTPTGDPRFEERPLWQPSRSRFGRLRVTRSRSLHPAASSRGRGRSCCLCAARLLQ